MKNILLTLMVFGVIGCSPANKEKSISELELELFGSKILSLPDPHLSCEAHTVLQIVPRRQKLVLENPFLFLRIHPRVKEILVNKFPSFIEQSTKYIPYVEFGYLVINAEDGFINFDSTRRYKDLYQFNVFSGILTVDEYFFDRTLVDPLLDNPYKETIGQHVQSFYKCEVVERLVDLRVDEPQ